MNQLDVSALDIRDFAISLNWKLVPEALKDGLFVLNSPANDGTQLIFTKETEGNKFEESATIAIRRLSELYNIPEKKIINDIREVNDDAISIRFYSKVKNVNSLLIDNLLQSIEATRQLILSAASTIVKPAVYHPKLNRTEPQELIKKIRFRHTQEGSFILKVSSPLEINAISNGLFGDEYPVPYARQTFSIINQAGLLLLDSIDANTEDQLIESLLQDRKPILSYNFCDALSNLYGEEEPLPYELFFDWSRKSKTKIPSPELPNKLNYSYDIKDKIDDIKVVLKREPSRIDDTFIATVESLNGDIGQDGHRSGEVRINILLDDKIVNTKVTLSSEQYALADEAHMHPGTYIKITGSLHPGKQFRLLDNISEFIILG